MAAAVLLELVHGAHAVLDHEHRLLVAVVQLVQDIAQAQRVDGPAPRRLLALRVGRAAETVEGIALLRHRRAVVGEAHEVEGVLREQLGVALLHHGVRAAVVEDLAREPGVGPAAHDVDEEVLLAALLVGSEDVARLAGRRVDRAHRVHRGEHRVGH